MGLIYYNTQSYHFFIKIIQKYLDLFQKLVFQCPSFCIDFMNIPKYKSIKKHLLENVNFRDTSNPFFKLFFSYTYIYTKKNMLLRIILLSLKYNVSQVHVQQGLQSKKIIGAKKSIDRGIF